MPDITVTISNAEAIVMDSFFEDAETGVRQSALRRAKSLAGVIVRESTSQYDPDKLSAIELRDEILALDAAGEIPTYAERQGT